MINKHNCIYTYKWKRFAGFSFVWLFVVGLSLVLFGGAPSDSGTKLPPKAWCKKDTFDFLACIHKRERERCRSSYQTQKNKEAKKDVRKCYLRSTFLFHNHGTTWKSLNPKSMIIDWSCFVRSYLYALGDYKPNRVVSSIRQNVFFRVSTKCLAEKKPGFVVWHGMFSTNVVASLTVFSESNSERAKRVEQRAERGLWFHPSPTTTTTTTTPTTTLFLLLCLLLFGLNDKKRGGKKKRTQ